MPLKCGIVGLPNVGKSTFFSALTQRQGLSANFPFSTIEPNVGVVTVPDERLKQLNQYVESESIVPTTVSFVDIAGLVKGASEGEGLGNQFLANIREVDALVHVVRCFEDDSIMHVAGEVDPAFDQEVINQELRLADIFSLKKKLEKVSKLTKTGKKDILKYQEIIEVFIKALQEGQDARMISLHAEEQIFAKEWQLLTKKPVLYVANIDEDSLVTRTNKHVRALQAAVENEYTQVLPICLGLEAQIVLLPAEEQKAYLEAYSLSETSLNLIIKKVYDLLGLMTYFTVGPKEIRAWTIPRKSAAPQAAAVIHSDFEKNFIKADVIKFSDFIHFQSEEKCRQAGKIGSEGKSYIVEDGDIIHFKCRS